MKNLWSTIAISLAVLALAPLVFAVLGYGIPLIPILLMNALGWILTALILVERQSLDRMMGERLEDFGVVRKSRTLLDSLERLMSEYTRRLGILKLNYAENPMHSKNDLTTSLRAIVNETHQLLGAASTELALFDKDSGSVHSSFVVGMPFRSDAPTVWRKYEQGLGESEDPHTIVQPVRYGGNLLGTIRAALPKPRIPKKSERELVQVVAAQSTAALLNAQYSDHLRRMRKGVDESMKAKTGFLANLSHEIRGPLGLILNAVELVLDELCGPVTPEQKETLAMVKKNGSHLLDLINDVLDYAKSESGKIKVEPAALCANEFLTEMLNVVRAQAEAKKHQVSLKLPNDKVHFNCDKRHARQMLINLLTNAIKYTPPGGKVAIQAEVAPSGKLKISVQDSGVGIAEADRAKVFSAFERVDDEYSSKQSGTGLGMPLTRKLAEINGGSVDFESTPGRGSLFWILLPQATASQVQAGATDVKETDTRGHGETLLIIEPNEGERGIVQRYLSSHGFAVKSVANQSDAQEVLTQQKIDLVILDNETLDHPEQQLLEMIQGSLARRKIPLILMSSKAFVFDIEEYLKQGVDRCLTKPFTMKELGKTCRELIDDNRRVVRHSQALMRPNLTN